MKKQLTIFFLHLLCLSARSQEFIKLTTPCTTEFLQKIPGKWIMKDNFQSPKIPKQQQQEIINQLDSIHRWLDKIYSPFFGIDATCNRTTSDAEFAREYKYENSPDAGFRSIQVNSVPVISYSYSVKFNEFLCSNRDPNEYLRYHGEAGVFLQILANTLGIVTSGAKGEMAEVMQIDRRPIWTMYPVTGKWKGYDVYSEVGSSQKIVLLHRKGMLPYIPVTRKQYLDRCIDYIPKFYDPMIKGVESLPDKEQRDELVKNYQKQKADQLKHYTDELEATTKAKLLDMPAIIPLNIFEISGNPIFSTEETGGQMLVIENPAYILKNLPKSSPQFFVFKLEKFAWPFPPLPDPNKVIEENFPIEKLQAMIDK